MYITVKLLNGFKKPLTYTVPQEWKIKPSVGSVVLVPLKNRHVHGVVTHLYYVVPQLPYAIKSAHKLERLPHDPYYQPFMQKLCTLYQTEPLHFIKRIKQFLLQKEKNNPDNSEPKKEVSAITLTQEQQACVDALKPAITESRYAPTVLHGVTGSGKTECYKELIADAIQQKKSCILLLPEVTLALNFYHLLKKQMQSIPIFSFHSAASIKEKRLLWQALMQGTPILIIGVHLPILLPISNLGLIIIDEEHDVGFQEKKHPKVNSKDAAILRAQLTQIPILLGSATPSLTSLYNVKTKGWNLFKLQKRFIGSFPEINIVSLSDKKERRTFWISKALLHGLRDCLSKKEQAIIFINRRGYSFFVQCKQCSFIFQCNNCSVSLTLHANKILQCHYCGITTQQPHECPTCQDPEKNFIKKGIGTQQMVSILQSLFPHASIKRADLDSTSNKKRWHETVDQMHNNEIDILVGTQTITKGYHFPNVTLVGIIWADLNLNFPLFNASETALQQLIQVAGRAGRSNKSSRVIVQTMLDHPILRYINEENYRRFYDYEIENRQSLSYPPHMRLAEIELKNNNELLVEKEVDLIAQRLNTIFKDSSVMILGPAKPPLHKIKNVYARKIYLKGPNLLHMAESFEKMKKDDCTSSVFFTPNPVTL